MSFLIDRFPISWTTILALCPAIFFAYCLLTKKPRHYPPGPKGLPLLGNLVQMNVNHLEVLLKDWAARFGDLTYLRILNQPMVILNDLETIRDLLDKRSSLYSDRPRFVLFSEMMGWQHASTHVRYGPRFRKHRRFIHQTFNRRATTAFHPLQERETLVLLDGLMQTPDLFVKHFKRFAAATIFSITYGHSITSVDDVFVKLAEEAATLTIESGTPAATLVDFFPILRHIPTWAPFSGFKRKALKTRMAVDKMMNIPFDMVKKQMRSGQARPSFTSALLEMYCDPSKATLSNEDEEDIKGAAGTLFAAAEDTTIAVMKSFILAMVRNPKVLHKAQEEIDRIIGHDRLPTLDDRGTLPYLECIMMEVLRWNPPVPLGMPHRVMEDDIYQGYHIPKGTTVMANIFTIMRNCPEPETFRPERYMETDDLPDPRDVVFGFGRRICPGRHFAEASLWSMMSNIIASLDISATAEDLEKGTIPALEVTSGFIRHPIPYACSIRPRSAKTTTLIQEAKIRADF